MTNLIALFVRRYVASLSIFGALVLFGVVSWLGVGIDLFPEIEVPVVSVSTPYAGAGSEEVLQQISEPIEGALATLPGVASITSTSREGISLVIAEFGADVDVDQAAIDVAQRVDQVVNRLPDDAGAPTIQKFDPNDQPILDVAVSAPGRSLLEVQRWVEDELQPELQRAPGVADVTVVGPVDREIQILVDPAELRNFGLTPDRVVSAVGASALDLPLGTVEVGDTRLLLAGRNTPASLAEIERILVDPASGLRLVDVAVVRDSAADVERYARLDGEPVVLLEVRKTSGGNSVAAADAVAETLAATDLPPGYDARVVGDTTEATEATVEDTLLELVIAVVAVALVITFFVGRLTTILAVVLAIPISLSGALILFGVMGFTFNLITLLAITVAVGLVVDDSIVVAENIDRIRESEPGLDRREVAVRGASEVATAVLAATLSLLAVFIPISLLPGVVGQFFQQFGLSMAAMILFSYLASLFFLTMVMAYLPNPLPPRWSALPGAARALRADLSWGRRLLRRWWLWLALAAAAALLALRVAPWTPLLLLALPPALVALRYLGRLALTAVGALLRSVYEGGRRLTDRARDAYAGSLRAALRRSGWVLGAAALLFASLGFVAPRLGFNFTPPQDTGELSATLELPDGSTLERTDAVAVRLERALLTDPRVTSVRITVGVDEDGSGGSDAGRATLDIELVGRAERSATTDELAPVLEAQLLRLLADTPEAELAVAPGGGAGGPATGGGYTLSLAANDLETLREREPEVRALLEGRSELRNVTSSLAATVDERVFVIDPAALSGTGLTPASVFGALRTFNVGSQAAQLRSGGEEVPIVVRLDPLLLQDEQALLGLPIYAPALQTSIPVGELGRFETRTAPSSIGRAEQAYALDFSADLAPGAPPELTVRTDIERALDARGLLGDGVEIGSGGGLDLVSDLATSAPIAFGLALLLNFLVIASQFNSFRFPIYLLLTVPLALIGAFWLLFVTGTSLDVITVLGIVMLIGLVTKNAILLLEVLLERVGEPGVSLADALVEAARLRFRPILMTALTVVIISLPLLLGIGEGAEFRRPLGMVILGGVLTSALLTFYVVPAAFYRFERTRFEGGGETDANTGATGGRSDGEAPGAARPVEA